MTAETALYGKLIALNTDASDRVTPWKMLQENEDFPLILYRRVSGPRQYTQQGDAQLIEPRIQMTLVGRSYTELEALYLQVVAGLDGWVDESAGVQHCFLMFELDQNEEQTGLYRRILDAQIGMKGYA